MREPVESAGFTYIVKSNGIFHLLFLFSYECR